MSMAGSERLFVAIPLPPVVSEALAGGQKKLSALLRERGLSARWAQPSGFHLTLFFLGPVAPTIRREVEAACALIAARSQPISLCVKGAGAFPSAPEARVLWAGVEGSEGLARLAAELQSALCALGFPPEKRPFRPHITLARFRNAADLARDLERFSPSWGAFEASGFALYRSVPAPGGSVYEVMQFFPFSFPGKIA
jgi:RNA 2',3'-cyclic 3'-phosphodiesterase